jgi:hypothetical protein
VQGKKMQQLGAAAEQSTLFSTNKLRLVSD